VVCIRTASNNSERRRRNKGNYITNKYYKTQKARKTFGPPVPKSLRHKDNNPPKRAQYFRVFRPERIMLCELENCYSQEHTRAQYRANRYLYYVVLRHLAKYLWFEPDRARIREVEHDLFNWLLSYQFYRGRCLEPNRVQIWSFRSPTVEYGHQQQKL